MEQVRASYASKIFFRELGQLPTFTKVGLVVALVLFTSTLALGIASFSIPWHRIVKVTLVTTGAAFLPISFLYVGIQVCSPRERKDIGIVEIEKGYPFSIYTPQKNDKNILVFKESNLTKYFIDQIDSAHALLQASVACKAWRRIIFSSPLLKEIISKAFIAFSTKPHPNLYDRLYRFEDLAKYFFNKLHTNLTSVDFNSEESVNQLKDHMHKQLSNVVCGKVSIRELFQSLVIYGHYFSLLVKHEYSEGECDGIIVFKKAAVGWTGLHVRFDSKKGSKQQIILNSPDLANHIGTLLKHESISATDLTSFIQNRPFKILTNEKISLKNFSPEERYKYGRGQLSLY